MGRRSIGTARPWALSTLALLAVVLLGGCGGDEPGTGPSGEDVPVMGISLENGSAEGTPLENGSAEDVQVAEAPSAGETRVLTFTDLSLVGADVNGLLRLIFEDDDPAETEWEFPANVEALDGEYVSIIGYMIALEYDEDPEDEDKTVTRFMLVRDLASCCFGGMPRPDEWLDVTLATPCEYWIYRPVRATGTISVGLDRFEDGLLASVFQIGGAEAEEVTR